LKKGPARIANRAWSGNDAARNLVIIPVGLTYEHFDGGGKSVMIHYGEPITRETIGNEVGTPNFVQQLNARIAAQLEKLAYVNRELQPDTPQHQQMMEAWQKAEQKQEDVLAKLNSASGEAAKAGKRWFTPIHLTLIALPHYWVSKAIARKLTKGSVFYDSIFYGLVLFLLPLYLLVLAGLIGYFI